MTTFYRFLSLRVWGNLPSFLQRSISKSYASIYDKALTRYLIKPYCKLNYKDPNYIDQFRSETGNNDFSSFQDFFVRVYKTPPKVKSTYVWPCEGLLCDYGPVGQLPEINVKGDVRSVKSIFGKFGKDIYDENYFSNVFLHNNNYHRIHAPVTSEVIDVEHINGDLVLLRPWVYKTDPSLPAMRNERVNIKLKDKLNRFWYLSIVGGPAVGTIVLNSTIQPGRSLSAADEIGKFLLGSTCCIVSPEPTNTPLGSTVYMADKY